MGLPEQVRMGEGVRHADNAKQCAAVAWLRRLTCTSFMHKKRGFESTVWVLCRNQDLCTKRGGIPPAAYAVSSAMMAMLSRSSAAQRARSRVNSAAKDSARAKIAHAVAASRALLRRLYHVEREMPSASQGCFAGRRGPMPCALRHRSERSRFFSRRSSSVCFVRNIFAVLRVKKSPPVLVLRPQKWGPKSVTLHPPSPRGYGGRRGNAPEPEKSKLKNQPGETARRMLRSGMTPVISTPSGCSS
jgi:hypothetical protein